MDFQFRGLFVGIVGLDLVWGVRETLHIRARARPRARICRAEQRSDGVLECGSVGLLVLCSPIFLRSLRSFAAIKIVCLMRV
jgi:hypothetical protein